MNSTHLPVVRRSRQKPAAASQSDTDSTIPRTSEAGQTRFRAIRFTGTAREYFGIWISNLVLSIITLGIYSAWAKVRRITYFHNNTLIDEFPLAYHATGRQILVGRLIVISILVLIEVLFFLNIVAYGLGLLALLIALPWMLNKSMKFSARMTSWRNVRFDWHGTYWRSCLYLVAAPLIIILSLGILTPFVYRRVYGYYANSHSLGETRFSANTKGRDFVNAFLKGAVLPSIVATAILAAATYPFMPPGNAVGAVDDRIIFAAVTFYLSLTFFTLAIFSTMCRNKLLNASLLGEVARFDSQVHPIGILWITVSNAAAIVLSLGLLIPWAKVRKYRYMCSRTNYCVEGDPDEFIDSSVRRRSAFGEELAEFQGAEFQI